MIRPRHPGRCGGKCQVAEIPCHVFTNGGHSQDRHSVLFSMIDHIGQVEDRLLLVGRADIHTDRHPGCIHPDGFLMVTVSFVAHSSNRTPFPRHPQHDGF